MFGIGVGIEECYSGNDLDRLRMGGMAWRFLVDRTLKFAHVDHLLTIICKNGSRGL
jgi:hypothetical protein